MLTILVYSPYPGESARIPCAKGHHPFRTVFFLIDAAVEGDCNLRWFKHLTESADDEKLAGILTQYGTEGYGAWWLVVEIVAKQMDKTDRCKVEYPLEIWSRKIFTSRRKTLNFLQVFSEKNLISLTKSENIISVEIPKLLKFRDEYSKKSG